MDGDDRPTPAALAARATMRFPNESAAYRAARTALLADEIALRRQIERVAARRRALPPGGVVDLARTRLVGADGPVDLSHLFGRHDTLVVYSWMFGPTRAQPCPMCTSLLSAWDGEAADVDRQVALAVVGRSPLARLQAAARDRGWRHLRLYSDADDAFSRDYFGVDADGNDMAAVTVFERRDGVIRHFWSGEMDDTTADPGEDARGAPDLMPLWTILDMTPAGRPPRWYPSLAYDREDRR